MSPNNEERHRRMEKLLVEAEQRVTEQALLVESLAFSGKDTKAAARTLRAFEGILFEASIAYQDVNKFVNTETVYNVSFDYFHTVELGIAPEHPMWSETDREAPAPPSSPKK